MNGSPRLSHDGDQHLFANSPKGLVTSVAVPTLMPLTRNSWSIDGDAAMFRPQCSYRWPPIEYRYDDTMLQAHAQRAMLNTNCDLDRPARDRARARACVYPLFAHTTCTAVRTNDFRTPQQPQHTDSSCACYLLLLHGSREVRLDPPSRARGSSCH